MLDDNDTAVSLEIGEYHFPHTVPVKVPCAVDPAVHQADSQYQGPVN
jgi:hypothetical protein